MKSHTLEIGMPGFKPQLCHELLGKSLDFLGFFFFGYKNRMKWSLGSLSALTSYDTVYDSEYPGRAGEEVVTAGKLLFSLENQLASQLLLFHGIGLGCLGEQAKINQGVIGYLKLKT